MPGAGGNSGRAPRSTRSPEATVAAVEAAMKRSGARTAPPEVGAEPSCQPLPGPGTTGDRRKLRRHLGELVARFTAEAVAALDRADKGGDLKRQSAEQVLATRFELAAVNAAGQIAELRKRGRKGDHAGR